MPGMRNGLSRWVPKPCVHIKALLVYTDVYRRMVGLFRSFVDLHDVDINLMDHALTNQDLGSDEASVSKALPDDAELQRRLEAYLERAIARRRRTPLLISTPILLGVFALWWICGVPELLYVSITESPIAYLERIGDRPDAGEILRRSVMDPNYLAMPTPPPTVWETAWEVRGLFALGLSLPLLFGVFGVWMVTVHRTRSRRRLLEGVRRSGFHACPCCGADVRSDSEPNCRICREIVVDRVPPFWRQYVLEDRRFARFGGLPKFGRVNLVNRFCVVNPPAERIWMYIGLTVSMFVFLTLLLILLFNPSSGSTQPLVVWGTATVVAIVLLSKRRKSSPIGFCPSCDYEQVSEDPTATCPECGTSHLIGQRVYTRRGDSVSWSVFKVVGMVLLGWSLFMAVGVVLLTIVQVVLGPLGVLPW